MQNEVTYLARASQLFTSVLTATASWWRISFSVLPSFL